MRTIFLLPFFYFVALTPVKSQEKALAKVHYQFTHVSDTTQRDRPLRDEVVLFLGQNSSYYRSFTEDKIKESLHAQRNAPNYDNHLVIEFSTTPIKNFYFYHFGDSSITDLESIASGFDLYYTETAFTIPQWTLLDDTKEIGGYLCQLATTDYKGRQYFAWFTTELPFQAGPWKLQGLPGLVLSAYDQRQEIVFSYAGFEPLDTKTEYEVAIPFYALKATKEEISKQRKVFEEDQGKYYELLNSSGRLAIGTSFYEIDYSKNTIDLKSDETYKPSFSTNNPIELSN